MHARVTAYPPPNCHSPAPRAHLVSAPGHSSHPSIAGSVLPIKRAEELLLSLPGVISARIIAADDGTVSDIHMLTTVEVNPKQTVRNVESALMAHLNMKVDHRKISVATLGGREAAGGGAGGVGGGGGGRRRGGDAAGAG